MICWRLGSTASGLKVFNGLGILDVSRFLLLEHRHWGCKPKGSRDIMCVCVRSLFASVTGVVVQKSAFLRCSSLKSFLQTLNPKP